MEVLTNLNLADWDGNASDLTAAQAVGALEQGKVLFLSRLAFSTLKDEWHLLSPRYANNKAKNISFDTSSDKLRGAVCSAEDYRLLKVLLSRFATQAVSLVVKLFPRYKPVIQMGRTSFRPVEIRGRLSSYRKDDTRLHVDAFPSSPVQNRRILRVFSNVNPNAQDRVWRIGAAFEEVARAFLPKVRRQLWGEPSILQALRITKSRRTKYDHYMLELHNRMKADMQYQATVEQIEIRFPPGSTWIFFSDQVSHAAISGQYALEQTLYLPMDAMVDPSRSPLRVLERLSGSRLI